MSPRASQVSEQRVRRQLNSGGRNYNVPGSPAALRNFQLNSNIPVGMEEVQQQFVTERVGTTSRVNLALDDNVTEGQANEGQGAEQALTWESQHHFRLSALLDDNLQMIDLVQEIEDDFATNKRLLNSLDKVGLEAECRMKMFNLSNNIIKKNLLKTNPTFDNRVESTIRQLQEEVQQVLLDLQSLKGEYFAAVDYICHKDVNTLRVDTVRRTRTKQLEIISKLDRVHSQINDQTTDVQEFHV